ncbi:hypothetical protein Dsin_024828 [Dipteronia sinensis]|uniref:Zinc knuckle CX2CX4HX4C domain-containing protein n=1 Tax=Dipteronia sinensis TaxID=43782 RepID=A0AAE0DWJ6_9ROSI|nr:hypothetical protein Dsin_024828 [Dipteronia sinensis]
MSATDLAGLYENLSLADEDGEMLEISEEAQLEGLKDVDRSLVGRVLSGRNVNREAFMAMINQFWSPFGSVEIELIVVVVGLKYERLPDFCFAYGRIGHVTKECTDEEARNGELDGSPAKYGSWLKVTGPEKTKSRAQRPFSGSSSDRDISQYKGTDLSGDRSLSLRPGSLASHNVESVSVVRTIRIAIAESQTETLKPDSGIGHPQTEKMMINGPGIGPGSITTNLGRQIGGSNNWGPTIGPLNNLDDSNIKGSAFMVEEAQLRRLGNIDNLPWVSGGDFNKLLSRNVKVVRFLADSQWRDKFVNYHVEHLGYNSSDHRPILMDCSSVTRYRIHIERKFWFEQFWLKKNDIGSVIVTVWQDGVPSILIEGLVCKLYQCASRLTDWSRIHFGNVQKQIGEKNREIECLYKCCGKPGIMLFIRKLEKEVEGLLECDKVYWKQRSIADWLKAGNRNSKFFHSKASDRKKKNSISCLIDANG